MIALVVFTDGRDDCLMRTLASAAEHLHGPITRRILFVDGGAAVPMDMLAAAVPEFEAWHVVPWGERRGFGGTIAAAWSLLSGPMLDTGDIEFVFHLEDDFVLHRAVDLVGMMHVLNSRRPLVQLALRRQPWNDVEREAGGIVECHPEAYMDCTMSGDPGLEYDPVWLEHRLFFTTNPSLYRRDLCRLGWPGDQRFSEGMFTHRLLEDPDVRFGFWGARDSGEWVEHIGTERIGTGY